MANSSKFPPNTSIHSFRDDSSTYSTESRDGVTTLDQSMDTSMTTDAVRRDRVKEWINSTEHQQKKIQRMAINPVLQLISNDPKVAQLVYDSSEFKEILNTFIKKGQKQAEAIQEQVPDDDIQDAHTTSMSFSEMDRPKLQSRLNIRFENATDQFLSKALPSFAQQKDAKSLSKYWDEHEEHPRFLQWLDLTMLYTPQSVEAGSRCTINTIFLGLAHMLKTKLRYEVVHVPELKVRAGRVVPVFTVATNPPSKVILSGSVDYAIVTRNTEGEGGNPTGAIQNLVERLTTNQDAATLYTDKTSAKLCILFVEAKKPPPTRKKTQDPFGWLREHEGQAVAEAMAGLRCHQLVDKSLDEKEFLGLPWALTDGVHWLFGMVVHTFDQAHNCSQWTTYELATAENDRRLTNNYEGLKRLMQILGYLATRRPEVVYQQIVT